MEMDTLYQELLVAPLSPPLWDLDPEWELNTGLLDNGDGGLLASDDGGLLVEDESFWGNEGIPLKEALLDSSGKSPGIDDQSIRDENPFAEWFDERVDLTEFDELIRSPEFDSVMHDLGETISILDGMESLSGVKQESLATEETQSTIDDVEVPIQFQKEENVSSSSEASPSFFVEATTSPMGSPGNELIGHPQQYVDVGYVDGDSTVDTNDLNDSSSNFGSPSCSTKPQSPRKSRTSQRKTRPKPYSRTSSSQNSDDGGADSSSSFEESHGCSVRGPKERKKVQNRCAATRYRMKKRTEQSELDKEEAELAAKNKELSQKADQLGTEIGYLKNLMREMLVSKGLLKKD